MRRTTGLLVLVGAMTAFPQVEPAYTDHYLSTFTIPIDNWNMAAQRETYVNIDPNTTPSYPSDFDPANVVNFQVTINNDYVNGKATKLYNLSGQKIGATYWGGAAHMVCYPIYSTCQVYLSRGAVDGSRFVNSEFDGAGRRGTITIQYHTPNGRRQKQKVSTHWMEQSALLLLKDIPTELNAGIISGMDAYIRSDYEASNSLPYNPEAPLNPPSTFINHFENESDNLGNALIYGKGGILSLTGTQIKFAPPINEWGNHNYGSKFFNSRYDNNSIIRGYTRLRYAAPVTVNGRQPFVVKSKYRKIGPWGFTLPGQGGTLTADLNGWFSNPGRIVGVDASLFSDMSGNSFAISNFRRSHERPDGWGLSGMRNGKVASELGVEVFSSSSGRTLLEVVNPTGNGYYSLWGHGGTTDNRGWIRLDYLAAKCGEGGNGFFTNAANIGYGFTPSDCSGYANADGIATHVIESQGQDISGNADQFRYLYKAGNYSTTLVGKIDQVEKSSAKALGCLMFRANTTPGSRNVALCRTGADSVYFQYRNTPDGPTTRSLFTQHPYSKWLKLEKSGDTFRAYVSDKDDSWNPSSTTGWVQIGSFYVPTIGSSYLYGIGASSNDASNPATVGILGVKTL